MARRSKSMKICTSRIIMKTYSSRILGILVSGKRSNKRWFLRDSIIRLGEKGIERDCTHCKKYRKLGIMNKCKPWLCPQRISKDSLRNLPKSKARKSLWSSSNLNHRRRNFILSQPPRTSNRKKFRIYK